MAINIKELMNETGLKLRESGDRKYIEISGKSYSKIQQKIKQYNLVHNTYIYVSNDYTKDATYLYL